MFSPIIATAVVLAGVIGCLATGAALQALTGTPGSVVYGNWRKHLWSVIFAAPVPFILALPGSAALNIVVAMAWLVLAPSVALKYAFGGTAPWSRMLVLHAVFGLAALAVYFAVTRLL